MLIFIIFSFSLCPPFNFSLLDFSFTLFSTCSESKSKHILYMAQGSYLMPRNKMPKLMRKCFKFQTYIQWQKQNIGILRSLLFLPSLQQEMPTPLATRILANCYFSNFMHMLLSPSVQQTITYQEYALIPKSILPYRHRLLRKSRFSHNYT